MQLEEHFLACLDAADRRAAPWPHLILRDCLGEDALDRLLALPFAAPELGGVSGERALHNDKRVYFNPQTRERFPVCQALAELFQAPRTVARLEERCGAALRGGFLRIEYAQDVDGFWLEPHTDIGAKRFSMLVYVSRDAAHRDLGTDIYDARRTPVARVPFVPGTALVFVPSQHSLHGFERRPIEGVRKSLIVNYVGPEWRARHELAWPEAPVA